MNWEAIRSKKIAGIPLLYLIAGAVVIFAVWAWQMKSTSTEEATGDEGTTQENVPESEDDSAAAGYEGLVGNGGTVVVQPAPTTETESEKETNDDWLRAAVTYLVEEKKVTPTEAQTAINNYLEGNDMTFEQGALKDAAIMKLGLPPERIAVLGNVGNKAEAPGQRQFSNFPGRHTVKGSNDNTPWKLSGIYYGTPNWDNANLIAAANPKLGPPTTTYQSGTTLTIPTLVQPSWATATSSNRYFRTMAPKNGTTVEVLRALNPNAQEPFAVGKKIRIR